MTTQTLLPNGTRSGSGDFTVTGVALIHVALNDSSDSTYVERTSTTATKNFVVNMQTYTLAADEKIEAVRVGVRMARGGAQSKVYVKQGYVGTDGSIRYSAADQYTGTLATSTVYGAWRSTAPDGQPWDQARLNDLVVKVTDYSPTSGGRSTFYEITVEALINEQPTVTADSPTGTVSDTSRPEIAWTYADADDDPQTVYEVRVFTAAQYGAAGFDPASSTATFETGLVTSSDPSVVVSEDLPNETTFRAYVRTGHALGSETFLSAWDYTQFTVDYDAPPAPELTATFSYQDQAAFVTAVGRSNYLSADDASLESTVGSWVAVTNCTVARSTLYGASGSASLSMTSTAAGTMVAHTGLYAVATDGQTISARAEFRPDASLRSCRVSLKWYDADGALLSTSDGTTVTGAIGSWTSATVSAVPPDDATQARVAVSVLATGGGSEVHYVDKVAVHPGPTAYWSPGGLYDDQVIVFERSLDNGVTWAALTTLDAGIPTQTAQGDDYAAPRDAVAFYRAKVVGYSGQDAVASAYASDAAAFAESDSAWWLKAPSDPALNVGAARVLGNSPISEERTANVGVFRPLGRSTAVVVTGDVYGYDGTYDVLAVGDTEWEALEALLFDYTGDLVVQSPFGDTKTVRVISRSVTTDGTPTLPRRIIAIGYVEV